MQDYVASSTTWRLSCHQLPGVVFFFGVSQEDGSGLFCVKILFRWTYGILLPYFFFKTTYDTRSVRWKLKPEALGPLEKEIAFDIS